MIKRWLVPSHSYTINMWILETHHLQLTAGWWIMVYPEQLWIKNWLIWTERKTLVFHLVLLTSKLKIEGIKRSCFSHCNNRWSLQHRCVWQGGRRRSWGEKCGAHARKRPSTQAASVHARWRSLRDLRVRVTHSTNKCWSVYQPLTKEAICHSHATHWAC